MKTRVPLTVAEVDEIKRLAAEGHNPNYIAKAVGRSYTAVSNVVAAKPPSGTVRKVLTPDEVRSIADAYASGESATSIAKRTGRITKVIVAALRRNGVVVDSTRQNERKFLPVLERAKELYAEGRTLKEVGEALGFAEMTVHTNFRREGVTTRAAVPNRMALDESLAMAEDYKVMSIQDIAKKYGCTAAAAYRALSAVGVDFQGQSPAEAAQRGEFRCAACRQFKTHDAYQLGSSFSVGHSYICKECTRWIRREETYGITREQYDRLLQEQGGRCAICGTAHVPTDMHPDLVIDHDHSTGKVRGLLCPNCNQGIGHLKDSAETTDRASAYLRRAAPPLTPAAPPYSPTPIGDEHGRPQSAAPVL